MGEEAEIEIPVANCLDAIATTADDYLQSHAYRREFPDLGKEQIASLRALSEKVKKEKLGARLKLFRWFEDAPYEVEGMEIIKEQR